MRQTTFHPNLDKGLNIRVNRHTRDRKDEEIDEAAKPDLAADGSVRFVFPLRVITFFVGFERDTKGRPTNIDTHTHRSCNVSFR